MTPSQIRKEAASLLRSLKNDYRTLSGDWTRREWYSSCRKTTYSYLDNSLRFYRSNPL